MDRFSLIFAASVLTAGSAHAFISPSPPPGFGGTPGNWTHTPPTAAQQLGQIMRGPGPRIPNGPVAGGAFRLGAGAARGLAGAVARGLIPGVGLALGLAWLASNCFEKEGGQWVRTCGPGLETPPQSDGIEYRIGVQDWHFTKMAACEPYMVLVDNERPEYTHHSPYITADGRCSWKQRTIYQPDVDLENDFPPSEFQTRQSLTCPAGWYVTPAGCMYSFPKPTVTPEQIEEEMAPKPLPQQLPPGFPYPLSPDAPFIFEPDTANPPNAQPVRIPQGNPVPIPNTNPQQYRQPVTRFTSSPTPEDPFRLDARPEDLIGESPTGITGPQPVTSGTPAGEKPEQFDLCKEHPDIIACQVFKPDELEAKPVPNENKTLAIAPDGGWGASSASCPADKTASLSFGPIAFSYEPLCLFASGIRPMVIALAWFSAALTFFGFARKDT